MNIQERRNKDGKITSYRIRVFDHTSVSLQLQAGISIEYAAKRAGHARPDATLSIYSHTLKKTICIAVKL